MAAKLVILFALLALVNADTIRMHAHVKPGVSVRFKCTHNSDVIGPITLEDGEDTQWSFENDSWGTVEYHCQVRTSEGQSTHFVANKQFRGDRGIFVKSMGVIGGSLAGEDQFLIKTW